MEIWCGFSLETELLECGMNEGCMLLTIYLPFRSLQVGVDILLIRFSDISPCHADLLSNLYYKAHQIPKHKCFSSRLAVVSAQSIEARR